MRATASTRAQRDWRVVAFAALCAAASLGFDWFGAERDRAAEGNRLYEAGRYEDAVTVYGEGLSDHPASTRLRFNLGAAQFKKGDLAGAAATIEKLAPAGADDDTASSRPPAHVEPALEGAAAYNLGNVRYRQGQTLEESDPAAALGLYDQALLAYKQAMARDPADDDPKFNHEFVEQQRAALEKRLKEQQEQQEQQQPPPQDQQGEQAGQDQQAGQGGENQQQEPQAQEERQTQPEQSTPENQQGEPQGQQQQPEQQPEQQARQEEQAPSEASEGEKGDEQPAPAGGTGSDQDQATAEKAPPSGGGGAQAAGEGEERMTAADAQALIDAARGEEVTPGELQRRLVVPAEIGEAENEW